MYALDDAGEDVLPDSRPPLDGTRVIELANVISGPYAGMILSDLGADVVKIELPGTGDPFRRWDAKSNESSVAFNSINRGKRSTALNIRTEMGKQDALKLIGDADAVIENFRAGFMDSIGLGYQAIEAINPGLIYCSIRGMNATDERPVYDAIAQARSGLWSQFTDMKRPNSTGPALADHLAGMHCAMSVVAALYQRTRTGHGCHLQLSMVGACVSLGVLAFGDFFATGSVADHLSRVRASQSHGFLCQDGQPIAIHLSSLDKFWTALTGALDARAVAEDERFASTASRIEHYEELHEALAEIFVTRPRGAWLEILERADVPVAPILTVEEAARDKIVESLDLFHDYGTGARTFRGVGLPVAGFAAPDRTARGVPWVGEHTAAVLGEVGRRASQPGSG